MKIIALFLSVVVLTLTLMPCCALEELDRHAQQITQQDTHQCNNQNEDCCKACSPFYRCGTCVGFTFNTQLPFAFVIQFKQVKQYCSTYAPEELSATLTAIWQPPNLG